MTIREILQNKTLAKNIAPLDLELLLSYAIQKPREYLFSHPEKELTKKQAEKIRKLAFRRAKGEPIAYILGEKEFFGLEFAVNRDVLIPRPETELLIDQVLRKIHNIQYNIQNTKIIDVGTGSGNIIISIAKNLPLKIREKINFYAIDISQKALKVARKNAKRHRVDKYINFFKSNLSECVPANGLRKNILIVANLPYVSREIYKKSRENLKYEPKTALVSQKRGLEHHIRLIGEIRKFFNLSSMFHVSCFMELSPEQKNAISGLVRKALPSAKVKFMKDLARRTRVAIIDKI